MQDSNYLRMERKKLSLTYKYLKRKEESLGKKLKSIIRAQNSRRDDSSSNDYRHLSLSSFIYISFILNPQRFYLGGQYKLEPVRLRKNGSYILFDVHPPFLFDQTHVLEGMSSNLIFGDTSTAFYLNKAGFSPLTNPLFEDLNSSPSYLILAISLLTAQIALTHYLSNISLIRSNEKEKDILVNLVSRFYGGLADSLLSGNPIKYEEVTVPISNINHPSTRNQKCSKYNFPESSLGDYNPSQLFSRIYDAYSKLLSPPGRQEKKESEFGPLFNNLEMTSQNAQYNEIDSLDGLFQQFSETITSFMEYKFGESIVNHPKINKVFPSLLEQIFSSYFPELDVLSPYGNYLRHKLVSIEAKKRKVGKKLSIITRKLQQENNPFTGNPLFPNLGVSEEEESEDYPPF